MHMPADVSFLMYDDFVWTKLTTPPLTVIAQRVYDMGAAAAQTFIRRIRQPGAGTVFSASLTLRGSIGAPSPETAPRSAAAGS